MNTGRERGMEKYHKDKPFMDPVLRCDSCSRIVLRSKVHELGMCTCGNRRVRNVLTLESDPEQSPSGFDEVARVKQWVEEKKVDPDWLEIFSEGGESDGE